MDTMGCSNPLPGIQAVLSSRGWVYPIEAVAIVGYQCKLVGLDWKSDFELATIVAEMHNVHFLETEVRNGFPMCRLNPQYELAL